MLKILRCGILAMLVAAVFVFASAAEGFVMDEVVDIPALKGVYPEIEDGFLPVCYRRDTEELVVAITIDDCNQPGNLSEMVRIISGAGGKATIFPIGENVPMLAKVLRSAHELGFEIENHTMSHSGLYWESDADLAYQIWQQDHEVDVVLGCDYRMRFLRPRGGDNRYDQRTHSYMRQMGYCAVAYWSQVGSGNTAAQLMADMQPGDILLFHTTDQDLQVIRDLVPMLRYKGYRMVTLNELYDLPENTQLPMDDQERPTELKPYVRFDQMIRRDDYLHDVYLIQERLTELGYLKCEYNGYFGRETQAALKQFQSDNGLDVDGVCGADTWNALFDYRAE